MILRDEIQKRAIMNEIQKTGVGCEPQRQLEIPVNAGMLSARIHELQSQIDVLIERLTPYSKQVAPPPKETKSCEQLYTTFGDQLRGLTLITENSIGAVNDLLDRLEI